MSEQRVVLDPVLVVGGCGGLGHWIVRKLLDEGYANDVVVFDLKLDPVRSHSKAKFEQGSLTSKEDVTRVLEKVKPRVVFNTASPAMMGHQAHKLFDEVNINGAKILTAALQELDAPVKTLVYTSSSSVVSNNYDDIVNGTEDMPLVMEPEQPEHYTHTKAVAEGIVIKANDPHNLLTAIIRPSTMFGEGDTQAIAPIVENARAGRGRFQVGDNTNMFDMTYIGNTALAHILAAKALVREASSPSTIDVAKKVNGETFFITNDEPWPFWNWPRAMGAAAGYPIKDKDVIRIPPNLYYMFAVFGEWAVKAFSMGKNESRINRKMVRYFTMTRTFDITKAKERLGYKPEVGMQEGIERGVKWYLENVANNKKKNDSSNKKSSLSSSSSSTTTPAVTNSEQVKDGETEKANVTPTTTVDASTTAKAPESTTTPATTSAAAA